MTGTGNLSVHLLPAWIPPGRLRGGVAVVIDVLRATTVMVQAFAQGCREIRPCLEVDQARDLAAGLPEGSALVAGEREALPIPGFDVGNSPREFTRDRCGGRTLVMTTTNGTKALLACRDADRVLVAAFTNRSAVLSALANESRPIHLVCAGTEGEPSLEDSWLAGSIAWGLMPGRRPDDLARLAMKAWRPDLEKSAHLEPALRKGKGGRRLVEIGCAPDIAAASKIDRFPRILPELADSPTRLILAP
ncbi:MAG: 2-phosphosulfolactate phosphatase [Isosphaeraceae bacterium]